VGTHKAIENCYLNTGYDLDVGCGKSINFTFFFYITITGKGTAKRKPY